MLEQPNTTEKEPEILEQEKLPQLYSKQLILIFSLLFSTIFAAVLLMSNLRHLGKRNQSWQVILFAVAFLFGTAALIQALGLPPNMSFIANVIGAAILNEYYWNKYIGRDQAYEKKSGWKPALISLLISIPTLILLVGNL